MSFLKIANRSRNLTLITQYLERSDLWNLALTSRFLKMWLKPLLYRPYEHLELSSHDYLGINKLVLILVRGTRLRGYVKSIKISSSLNAVRRVITEDRLDSEIQFAKWAQKKVLQAIISHRIVRMDGGAEFFLQLLSTAPDASLALILALSHDLTHLSLDHENDCLYNMGNLYYGLMLNCPRVASRQRVLKKLRHLSIRCSHDGPIEETTAIIYPSMLELSLEHLRISNFAHLHPTPGAIPHNLRKLELLGVAIEPQTLISLFASGSCNSLRHLNINTLWSSDDDVNNDKSFLVKWAKWDYQILSRLLCIYAPDIETLVLSQDFWGRGVSNLYVAHNMCMLHSLNLLAINVHPLIHPPEYAFLNRLPGFLERLEVGVYGDGPLVGAGVPRFSYVNWWMNWWVFWSPRSVRSCWAWAGFGFS